jgi:O-antigen ligase
MTGVILCAVAFFGPLLLARRSLAAGLGYVLAVGYSYGILRANYLDSATYFLFDAAVLGLYLGLWLRPPAGLTAERLRTLRQWVLLLIGWTVVMSLLPVQHMLIQMVGLRGNAFLVPFLLLGGLLRDGESRRLAIWLATLNLIAFGFAAAEYIIGVPAFYPVNAVTEIIYKSNDVADYTAYRIPASFANAHAYAGTMVASLPWLVGGWVQARGSLWRQGLLSAAILVALLGVFMSATRMHTAVLLLVIVVTTFSGRLRWQVWIVWVVLIAGIAYVVSSDERLQRFTTLSDTDRVIERVEGSVNMSFLELLAIYPMGNGMGAGGTSIPYFLQDLVHNPIGLENEYSRILLEQGFPGLCLWAGFIIWLVVRRPADPGDPWLLGRRLMWYVGLAGFATGLIGIGLMTSVPQTVLFFLSIGCAATPAAGAETARDQAATRTSLNHAKLSHLGA